MRPHHAFMLTEHLSHLEYLDESIGRFTDEVNERLSDAAEQIMLLDTIPGLSRRAAEVILAEIGTDMSRFPSAKHLASWAGICPGNYESAGKRKSGKTRKGSRWLRQLLIEAAHGAAHQADIPRSLIPAAGGKAREEEGFSRGRACDPLDHLSRSDAS